MIDIEHIYWMLIRKTIESLPQIAVVTAAVVYVIRSTRKPNK